MARLNLSEEEKKIINKKIADLENEFNTHSDGDILEAVFVRRKKRIKDLDASRKITEELLKKRATR